MGSFDPAIALEALAAFKARMKILLVTMFAALFVAKSQACIGAGCLWDKMEERFFWISDRIGSEAESVREQGGPQAYCNSLGLAITAPGTTLWRRAEELQRKAEEFDPAPNRSNLYPAKTICHEMKWN